MGSLTGSPQPTARSLAPLAMLAETAGLLLASDNLHDGIAGACRTAMEFLAGQVFLSHLMDIAQGDLRLDAYGGIPEDEAQQVAFLDYAAAVSGRVVRDGCPIVAEHILQGADPSTSRLRTFGIDAFACQPIMSRSRVVGTLSFGTRSRPVFSAGDLALMRAVADQVALAITPTRAGAERERLLAAEREARRLADAAVHDRDEFLSVAAHELKTPITSLRGHAELLVRQMQKTGELDPARVRQAMAQIDRQSRRLTNLINQLLDLSRIVAGRLALELDVADVAAMVEEAVSLLQSMHPRCVLALHCQGPLPATVDALRLEQVIINLLDNAVKFSPPQAPIEVRVEGVQRDAVQIAVRDHGIGIPADQRAHIFERFCRAHGGGYGGMGLGLYVSQQIVELHGGTIALDCPADGGSCFTVTLPRCGTAWPLREQPPGAGADE